MKNALKKQLLLKNWKNLQNFLVFQKQINPKTNSFQSIGYPNARKTIGKS